MNILSKRQFFIYSDLHSSDDEKNGNIEKIKKLIHGLDEILRTPLSHGLGKLGFDSFSYFLKLGGMTAEEWDSGIDDIDKCNPDNMHTCNVLMEQAAKMIPFVKNLMMVGQKSKMPEDGGKIGQFFASIAPLMGDSAKFTEDLKIFNEYSKTWASVRITTKHVRDAESKGDSAAAGRKNQILESHQNKLNKLKESGAYEVYNNLYRLWSLMKAHMEKMRKKANTLLEALADLKTSLKISKLNARCLKDGKTLMLDLFSTHPTVCLLTGDRPNRNPMNALKVLSKRMLSWFIARARATIKDKSGKEHEVTQPISLAMASLQESGDAEDLIEILGTEMDSLMPGQRDDLQRDQAQQKIVNRIKNDKNSILDHFISIFQEHGESRAIASFKALMKRTVFEEAKKTHTVSKDAPIGDDGKESKEQSLADKKQNPAQHVEDKAGAKNRAESIKTLIFSLDKLLKTPLGENTYLGKKKFDSLEYFLKTGGMTKEVWEKGIADLSRDADKCDIDHLDVCKNVMTDAAELMPFIRNLIGTEGKKSKRSPEGSKPNAFFKQFSQYIDPENKEKYDQDVANFNVWEKATASLRQAKLQLKDSPDDPRKKQELEKWTATVESLKAKKVDDGHKAVRTFYYKMKGFTEKIPQKAQEVADALEKLQQVARAAYLLGMALRKQGMLSKRFMN